MDVVEFLSSIELFGRLKTPALRQLSRSLQTLHVPTHAHLISRGDPADAIYFVLSGLFEVCVDDDSPSGILIGRGQPVGEIGFFAGLPRTASVVAKRDSLVMVLARTGYEELVAQFPEIKDVLIRSLSERLFRTTERMDRQVPFAPARILAVLSIGSKRVSDRFANMLLDALAQTGSARIVDWTTAGAVPGRADRRSALAVWLDQASSGTDSLLLLADPVDPEWTQVALEHADEVLMVGDTAGTAAPGPAELRLAGILSKRPRRIVLLHEERQRSYANTRQWLETREAAPHHHVAAGHAGDYQRLVRFIKGTATGLVTSGGGAFCAAHIGVYKAFRERGVVFDVYGGTSGGGAMAAAFASQLDPEDIDRRLHDIFITRASLGKLTVPRYSLFDQIPFDAALRAHYPQAHVEDLAIPFFAIATDLVENGEVRLRRGPLWQAVRATGSIPGLLPPYITEEGRILIDGSLVNNVPVSAMHEEKTGPNMIVDFGQPAGSLPLARYDSLPGRWRLAAAHLFPLARRALPDAPRLQSVIVRAMMMSRNRAELARTDRVLTPPLPAGMNILDWSRHSELVRSAYEHVRAEIRCAEEAGDPVYRAILASAGPDGLQAPSAHPAAC